MPLVVQMLGLPQIVVHDLTFVKDPSPSVLPVLRWYVVPIPAVMYGPPPESPSHTAGATPQFLRQSLPSFKPDFPIREMRFPLLQPTDSPCLISTFPARPQTACAPYPSYSGNEVTFSAALAQLQFGK